MSGTHCRHPVASWVGHTQTWLPPRQGGLGSSGLMEPVATPCTVSCQPGPRPGWAPRGDISDKKAGQSCAVSRLEDPGGCLEEGARGDSSV